MFFFFQAEDGIRDIGVTGVQTCALPISLITTLTLIECFGLSEMRVQRYEELSDSLLVCFDVTFYLVFFNHLALFGPLFYVNYGVFELWRCTKKLLISNSLWIIFCTFAP